MVDGGDWASVSRGMSGVEACVDMMLHKLEEVNFGQK